jgi:hypothetical protein
LQFTLLHDSVQDSCQGGIRLPGRSNRHATPCVALQLTEPLCKALHSDVA